MSVSQDNVLQKPGYLGRGLRLVAGVWQIYFVSEVIRNFDWVIFRSDFYDWGMIWFGVAIAYYYLHEAINLGFSVSWGRRVQQILLVGIVLAGITNFLQSGTFWGPFVTILLIVPSLYMHIHVGISHVLSAFIGTPGCEMRSIPHLAAILRNESLEGVVCPGWWDSFDAWEHRSLIKN